MQKLIKNVPFVMVFAVIIAAFVCTDLPPSNPFDPDNPDYIKTQIAIIIDSTGGDSLFYTDSPVKIGIEAKAIEVMDRIEKILVDFGVGDPITKVKPASHPFVKLWCDSTHIYPAVGKQVIVVKVVTVNHDDILDSTEITINGRAAYIVTHPQVFSDPFQEKDSLYLSVTGAGTAPLAYQWYKDSVPIADKKLEYCIIPSLSLIDSGDYYCEVSNTYGSGASNKTRIRVIPETADTSWPSVFFSAAASQGPENNNASIQINLSKPFAKDNVTVRIQVNASSSAGAQDYAFKDTVLQYLPNEVTKNVVITITNDSINEDNETVILDLKSAKNGVLIPDSILGHTYTIVDNDESLVQFVSASFSSVETDSTTLHDSIAVILSGPNDKPATIDYAIVPDSTTATGSGVDYTLLGTGKLTFPAFSDTAWLKLDIIGDTLSEKNEIIFLALSNPTGGISLSTANITCKYTIIEDDNVIIAFDQGQTLTVSENGSQIDLAVSISKQCELSVTCAYKVSGGTASGGGVDYTLLGNGSITFSPGTVLKLISLSIVDDAVAEPDETVNLEIYSPSSNAAIGTPDSLTVTILDNEKPEVFFKEPALAGLESVTSVNIPVSLSFSPQKQVTVSYTVNQNSSAVNNKDYTLATSTLVFSIGDTVTKNINFTVTDDQINEFDETIIIDLTTVENGTLHATKTRHTYTITDNDNSNCGFSELTYTLLETNTGTEKDSIEVVLSSVNEIETSVEYKVIPGSTTATGGGVDYTLSGTGKLTFPANSLRQYIILDVIGDTLAEGDENIQFALFNPAGGITLAGQDTLCTYVIRDNDVVTISFDGTQTNTIDENGTSISLIVLLSKECLEKVTVGYSVTGGTASGSGVDFTLTGTGVLEFAPGELQKPITVDIVDDQTPEPEETVILELNTPSSNAVLGTVKNFTLTILDNEKPSVSFQEIAVNKFESEISVNIPLVLSFAPQKQVSVPFTVLLTSTASSADYSLSATPLVFDAGPVTTKNIVLTVVNDKDDESDETVVIELGAPSNAVLGTNKTYTYTINDDEYTIIMAKTGEGTTVPATSAIVSRGENLPVIARPSLYWHFDNWTRTTDLTLADENDTATSLTNITTAGTVTANFGRITHIVTVAASSGGTVTPSGDQTVPNGGSLDISANANTHYNFVNWTSANLTIETATSASTRVTGVTVAGTVTANFTPVLYALTINKNGSGTGTLNQSSQNVPYNGTITITATPTAPGNNFGGWAFTPTNIVPVDGNASSLTEEFRVLGTGTITATFNKNDYQVVLLSYNVDYGTVVTSTPQTISHDSSFSIHARVKRGCKFTGWTAAPAANISFAVAGDSITNATVTGAATITANFDMISGVNNVVYVDSAAGLPVIDQDGSNWYRAFSSLESGLAAGGNKEVWVAKGTYSPSTTTPFSPVSNSKVYGGFNAIEETRDVRNFVLNRTILDAGATANTTVQMDNLQKTIIDGFILMGAKSNGYNILISAIQDSLFVINCIIDNKNVESYGGINMLGDSRSKVVLLINCVFTNIRAKSSAPVNVRYITGTFINTIIYNNVINSTGGVTGGLNVSSGGCANLIHTALINNVTEVAASVDLPNSIYKSSTASVKSTLKIYNSVIWNDADHSLNGRFLVNLIDSLANDEVEYSTLDSLKIRTRYFKANGTTWEYNKDAAPNFVSLSDPGGSMDEKWFTSNSGLIYAQDKPGVNDGNVGYIDYTWLQWDIRGTGFVRNKTTPDIGPYEKQ